MYLEEKRFRSIISFKMHKIYFVKIAYLSSRNKNSTITVLYEFPK